MKSVKSQEISTFAQNLSRIRKQRGLSQADLADISGLTRRTINHYENRVSQPPFEKIEAIATALNIKTSELLDKNSKAAHINQNVDLTGIDPRSVKKLKDILSLPPEDRNDLYRILNKMLRKNQLENQKLPGHGS
jgi:transcriptional regulator with XRE-family HTH domain